VKSLYGRLSLVFLCILLLLGSFSLWIAHRSAVEYFLEFTQRLNAPIAMYMAADSELVKDGEINGMALTDLAEHVMMINPSVEVYLLDTDGYVMAQAVDENINAQSRVSLEPIRKFLEIESAAQAFPLYGDNPRNSDEQRVFSAHPIMTGDELAGYVYVVLAGEQHQTMLASIRSSYSVRTLVATFAGVLLLATIGGCAVFFMLTYRLRALTRRVHHWRENIPGNSPGEHQALVSAVSCPRSGSAGKTNPSARLDEIDELATAYDAMADRLLQQYHALEQKDQSRRELFADISHDLRTPLTTMQGYLETVLLKQDQLGPDVQRRYLSIAHKHSQRLRNLVDQLFELSKLNSGEQVLQCEAFSLLEMAHDSVQDFAMRAEQQKILLKVMPEGVNDNSLHVLADIALVQRVFENLLDNALRYTPKHGTISIHIGREREELVSVMLSDSGVGMSASDAQRVFEPRFTLDENTESHHHHAGLGLAIVHSILSLHSCEIRVSSTPGVGTSFNFELPATTDMRQHLPAAVA
jgi:signal transduction histidine kinase